jgi:site-specific DNA recombinase
MIREMDRLSRNLAKQLIVEEELRRAGVQIEYAMADYPDTPEGRLNKHIRATIAEYESEKITERMSRGRRQKVKAGNVLVASRPPYGYDVAEVDGKSTLVINEQEARIIKLIFTWYVEGDDKGRAMSINEITHTLGEMGIPTRGDQRPGLAKKKRGRGKWHRGTVHRMLTNQTYCGVWHYGKRRRDGGEWVCNDSSDHLPVSVPSIVSVDMWEAAQVRLAENRTQRRPRRYQYLLSGRVTCGEFGLKMAGKPGGTQRYYRCPSRSNPLKYARECNSPGFRSDRVDTVVWEWVVRFLTDPIDLETGL